MRVPLERVEFRPASDDETWDHITRMYVAASPGTRSGEMSSFREDGLVTPGLSVFRQSLGYPFRCQFEVPGDGVAVCAWLDARFALDFGRLGTSAQVGGDCYLLLPGSSGSAVSERFSSVAVLVDADTLARVGRELTGMPLGALRFSSFLPLDEASAATWQQTATMLWGLLEPVTEEPGLSSLVHLELVEIVVASMLTCFPNTAMTRGYVPGPGDAKPAAVRRAVAFIESQASLPITLTDIAVAAGTTPAALRAAFQRHLGTSPGDYLRRARLDGARAELQLTDRSPDAVAKAAATWGFADTDAFARDYDVAFGRPPADSS